MQIPVHRDEQKAEFNTGWSQDALPMICSTSLALRMTVFLHISDPCGNTSKYKQKTEPRTHLPLKIGSQADTVSED